MVFNMFLDVFFFYVFIIFFYVNFFIVYLEKILINEIWFICVYVILYVVDNNGVILV